MCITEYNEAETMEMIKEAAIAEGMKKGRTEGKAEGKALGIIEFALDIGYTNDQIISVLQERLGIGIGEAEKYLEQFYGKAL